MYPVVPGSKFDALLLKLLPVKEPERLVLFKSISQREFSPGIYSRHWDRDPATGQNVMTSFAFFRAFRYWGASRLRAAFTFVAR
jgi:hypothetical protein